MYTLRNSRLSVSILDPVADVARQGSRYCTGGYIWQVTDADQNHLLAGPKYPDPNPDTFNGQGAPDMFMDTLGGETAPVGELVGCIGVGVVRRTSPFEPFSVRHNPEVVAFLTWDVQISDTSIIMRAEHTFGAWSYALKREVILTDRTVDSRTSVRNTGAADLPIRWFPHPFFPPNPDGVQCRLSIPVSVPENPGFVLDARGWIRLRPEHDWNRGCIQALDYDKSAPSLSVTQRHPKTGQITMAVSYAPSYMPIWGNANTFSVEPYHSAKLAAAEQDAWSVRYTFGL